MIVGPGPVVESALALKCFSLQSSNSVVDSLWKRVAPDSSDFISTEISVCDCMSLGSQAAIPQGQPCDSMVEVGVVHPWTAILAA